MTSAPLSVISPFTLLPPSVTVVPLSREILPFTTSIAPPTLSVERNGNAQVSAHAAASEGLREGWSSLDGQTAIYTDWAGSDRT